MVVVHLLKTDGTVACKGLQLVKLGRPLDRDPLRITVHASEATCQICLAAWNRLKS